MGGYALRIQPTQQLAENVMHLTRLMTLVLGLSLLGLLSGCPAADGGAVGDHCHDDGECNDGLHCHIEDGEDEGECEAEEST